MFRITEDPSSGSLVQYFAKITKMALSCVIVTIYLYISCIIKCLNVIDARCKYKD